MATRKNITMPNSNYMQLDSRVGKLEVGVDLLTQEIKEVGQTVKSIANDFGSFKDGVLSQISYATAPKWPLIVSIGSLLLAILGLSGSIIAISISGQDKAIAANQSAIVTLNEKQEAIHAIASVHDAWRIEINSIIKEIKEWRLSHIELDAKYHTKVDRLIKDVEDINARLCFDNKERLWLKELSDFKKNLTDHIDNQR